MGHEFVLYEICDIEDYNATVEGSDKVLTRAKQQLFTVVDQRAARPERELR